MVKWLASVLTIVLLLPAVISSPALAAVEPGTSSVKELNLVYMHGMGGDSCSLQLLADHITKQLPSQIAGYEQANPGITVQTSTFIRCYPNDTEITAWAANVAEAINTYLPDRRNLILIGHSMGGKAALYAVAHNVGNIADRVLMVVTINSPVKSLKDYYLVAGASASDYYKALGLITDRGVLNSAVYYDSSADGKKVSATRHWLALVSGESAPSSNEYNMAGMDPFPWDMDDNIVPLSAQYADGAEVVYYGIRSHTEVGEEEDVADYLAQQILATIFGGEIQVSLFAGSGNFEHRADWVPGNDYWKDMAGEIPAGSGTVEHFNPSFTRWQVYEDVVGEDISGGLRSSFQATPVTSFPFLAGIREVRWANPDDLADCRVYIKTRLAPRNTIKLEWKAVQQGMLPAGVKRDHYEVSIVSGTPFANLTDVDWAGSEPRDIRLRIFSNAESPYRWFEATWRVYYKESRTLKVIDEVS
jgi:pimeloyl-ACP methyl ester carboxylesterase